MRFSFDPRKSIRLRENPKRGIGFEEARELFKRPYWMDQRCDEGEILHLVTLWKSTAEEVRQYEENS